MPSRSVVTKVTRKRARRGQSPSNKKRPTRSDRKMAEAPRKPPGAGRPKGGRGASKHAQGPQPLVVRRPAVRWCGVVFEVVGVAFATLLVTIMKAYGLSWEVEEPLKALKNLPRESFSRKNLAVEILLHPSFHVP